MCTAAARRPVQPRPTRRSVGHTIVSEDGVVQFVCAGGSCFQGVFGVSAALCAFLALVPTLVLLWMTMNVPAGAAKESLAMQVRGVHPGGGAEGGVSPTPRTPAPPLQDAMSAANTFDSQLEIDLDMIRADEHTDSGCVRGGRSMLDPSVTLLTSSPQFQRSREPHAGNGGAASAQPRRER